uniref:Uncharacterized protein n=1 Tax=Anguilla anguilla TaxID=7936 RepID=A0A0E9Q2J9_ANGAN
MSVMRLSLIEVKRQKKSKEVNI